MFDFFSLMVAVVALIVSAKAFKQITMLRARLDALERSPAETRAAVAAPPLASYQQAELPDPSPGIAAEHSMPAAETAAAAPMTGAYAAAENAADAAYLRRCRNRPIPGASKSGSAHAGWFGSAASRWRSAVFSWCAIRSKPA